MSFERACVNCERCFGLAKQRIRDSVCEVTDKLMERTREERATIKNTLDGIAKDCRESGKNPLEQEDYKKALEQVSKIYSSVDKLEFDSGYRLDVNLNNDQVYAAKNEAMRALENIIDVSTTWARFRTGAGDDIMKYYGVYTGGPNAEKALQACRNCDYSSPKIAEVVKGHEKKE